MRTRRYGSRCPTTAELDYVRIAAADLPGQIGKGIHLGWAIPGCVWRLERIEGGLIHLITPTTRRRRTAYAHDAYYTRNNEPKGATK